MSNQIRPEKTEMLLEFVESAKNFDDLEVLAKNAELSDAEIEFFLILAANASTAAIEKAVGFTGGTEFDDMELFIKMKESYFRKIKIAGFDYSKKDIYVVKDENGSLDVHRTDKSDADTPYK